MAHWRVVAPTTSREIDSTVMQRTIVGRWLFPRSTLISIRPSYVHGSIVQLRFTLDYSYHISKVNQSWRCVMEEVRETLRTHSRYIRDTLLPLVTDQKGSKLNSRDIYCLRTALYEVNAIPITLDLLRYSRIEKALVFIAMDPRWPAEATSRAAKILTKWEKSFGPVDDLRADLWGPGGRLEGLKKMKGPRGATAEKAEVT